MGIRLGVDVGKARIGLARSDASGMLATPLTTVRRAQTGDDDITEILTAAREWEAIELVVGLPLSLSGARTPSTEDAAQFAERLASAGPHPVRLVDERLSTVSAQAALHASGRNSKKSRPVIDQVAAVIILQHALDSERSGATPPGTVLPTEGQRF